MLSGVDISSWQAGISPSALDADFVIVKATGGASYENPHWRQWADEVLGCGKLLGLYHFANDTGKASAAEEARFFLERVAPYRGRFVPILDWESRATENPVSWAAEWLDAVARETGATPWFYSYASYVGSHDCSAIAGYPLWIAAYYAGYEPMGYQPDPPLVGGTGSWERATAYQYTSSGRVGGWGGNLDLSAFYGTRDDWIRMEGADMARCADVARQIHRRMVDDGRFGYSWEERHGAVPETWSVEGKDYTLNVGDYDCSSSTITAWKLALQGTPYEGALDGATYTGNMRRVFVGSGLFDWVPVSWAEPGDLYLNEANHVAMCQGGGLLSEFCWGDNGAYGNRRGDQSGHEAYCHGFYSYPWDGCLHYNKRADTEDDEMAMAEVWVPDAGTPVHRLYAADTGEHMYTASAAERDALVNGGWGYEGVAWTCPDAQVAVYRMYNPHGKHHFTADFDEARVLQKAGWAYEGVQFFASKEGKPVHRLYNPNAGDHFLTVDAAERDGLVDAGWTYEGEAFRV